MEKHSKKIENFTDKALERAGLEKPSVSFLDDVMEKVEQTSIQTVYTPLVTKKGWWLVAAVFVGVVAMLYFYQPEILPYFSNSIQTPMFKNPFEDVEVSKTTIYAIGFLGLFLVQLPFLKRLIGNQQS